MRKSGHNEAVSQITKRAPPPGAIHGGRMDFDEAARIVESLVARYPDRPPHDIWRAFQTVFGAALPAPAS